MVNSDERQLGIPEIFVEAMREQNVPRDQYAATLVSFAKEASLPNTDLRNFGNTLFLSHIKEKNGTKVAFGRALNADIARNYLQNGEAFFKFLISEKVDYYITFYSDPRLDIIFRYIQRPEVQKRVGGKATVTTRKNKTSTAVVVQIEAP